MYQTEVLDNGLKVVTAHMPQMQSVCLGFWIKAGGRYETKKQAGISHFLEHLLFEDTKKRSSKEIKEAIEGIGGSLNGFTSEEMTCFFVKILSKHMDLSFDILSDMVLNAALAPAAIEKERSVIAEEIKMYKDLPGQYVLELLGALMWPNHPLGMFLAGTVETVNSITRQNLIDYKNKFYAPNNTIIVAAGPLKHDIIRKACARHFNKLKKRETVSFEPVSVTQKAASHNLHYKDTEQIHIAMGVPAVSAGDPDRFTMSLINIILGANMSSRLFQEIREKRGLAYEINSGVKKYKDTGCFVVSAGIKVKKFCEAVEIILKEMKNIKMSPPGEPELKRAKEFYSGQLLMSLEDTSDHMVWAGEQVIMRDKIIKKEDVLKNINAVKAKDISRVASRFFKADKLNLAVIGPIQDEDKKQIDKILETLG